MTKPKSFQRLTAQRKLELYQATRDPQAPLGDLLRQYGVHLDDLREIERTVEEAALTALKVQGRHGRLPTDVTPERVLHLERELREKTAALAELSVAYTLLEKKEREESPARNRANRSPWRTAK
jgi:transposase-like protein